MKNSKSKLLSSFDKIFNDSKKYGTEDSLFKKLDSDISNVSQYFNTSETQSFYLAVIFVMNIRGKKVDIQELIRHLDCPSATLLKNLNSIESLVELNILKKTIRSSRDKISLLNSQYYINQQVVESVLSNQPFYSNVKEERFENVIEVLQFINSLYEQRTDEDLSTNELLHQTAKTIKEHSNFLLFKEVLKLDLNKVDSFIITYLVWITITGYETIDLGSTAESLFDNSSKRISFIQNVICDKNILMKAGFLEIVESKFFNNSELKLTAKSLNLINDSGLKTVSSKQNKNISILPENILPKKLIFNTGEMEQLTLLRSVLSDEKLQKTRERLKSKNLPTGITALLHGISGSGKSASVYQMARETHREIMRVDISESKSAFYSESERLIKKIFTDYRKLKNELQNIPVLFFNESDALINRRRSLTDSSVNATENSIQNILLQELEDFDGILFATSNFTHTLCPAFNRRFLFKIEFGLPNLLTRSRIWRLQLPSLSHRDAKKLATFEMTGATIENIVKKAEINEIIHGVESNFETIFNIAQEEMNFKNYQTIGFKN